MGGVGSSGMCVCRGPKNAYAFSAFFEFLLLARVHFLAHVHVLGFHGARSAPGAIFPGAKRRENFLRVFLRFLQENPHFRRSGVCFFQDFQPGFPCIFLHFLGFWVAVHFF